MRIAASPAFAGSAARRSRQSARQGCEALRQRIRPMDEPERTAWPEDRGTGADPPVEALRREAVGGGPLGVGGGAIAPVLEKGGVRQHLVEGIRQQAVGGSYRPGASTSVSITAAGNGVECGVRAGQLGHRRITLDQRDGQARPQHGAGEADDPRSRSEIAKPLARLWRQEPREQHPIRSGPVGTARRLAQMQPAAEKGVRVAHGSRNSCARPASFRMRRAWAP